MTTIYQAPPGSPGIRIGDDWIVPDEQGRVALPDGDAVYECCAHFYYKLIRVVAEPARVAEPAIVTEPATEEREHLKRRKNAK